MATFELEDLPTCPACAGQGLFLGTLGLRDWMRCRACGMEFSHQCDTDTIDTMGEHDHVLSGGNEDA